MWKDLTLRQRAHLISEGVKAGIGNAVTIRKLYDQQHTFGGGGTIYDYGYNSWVDVAKDFIKQNEGWRNLPYKDGKGLYSIGWGFNDSGFRSKYPMGISQYYKNGITQEQAEQELNWYLGNAINHLQKYYGSKWNQLSDYQKVALLDTYYQRPASIINSTVRDAIINDDPNAYTLIGVRGYDNRNDSRRAFFQNTGMPSFIRTLTPEQREMLQYQTGNSLPFQGGMTYNLPEVVITADKPTLPVAESDVKLAPYEDVAGLGPIEMPKQEETAQQSEQQIPELPQLTRQMPPDIFDASLDYDDNDYYTFKGALRSDLVKQENKIKRMHDMEMAMYNQKMSDINNNIIQTDMFNNPILARGGTIHIDPENRGKFNETKRRTGKTTEELTHSSNPLTRKRAIFAQNAAKWNHANGGSIADYYAALAAMYPTYNNDNEHLTITDEPEWQGGGAGGRFAYGGNMYAMGGDSTEPDPPKKQGFLSRIADAFMGQMTGGNWSNGSGYGINYLVPEKSRQAQQAMINYGAKHGQRLASVMSTAGGGRDALKDGADYLMNNANQLIANDKEYFGGEVPVTIIGDKKKVNNRKETTNVLIRRKKNSHKAGVKRNHASGGYLEGNDYDLSPEQYNRLLNLGYDMDVVHNENIYNRI